MSKPPKEKGTPHSGRAMTLREVAAEMGTTAERVRQIEARALAKLEGVLRRRGVTAEFILPENFDSLRA